MLLILPKIDKLSDGRSLGDHGLNKQQQQQLESTGLLQHTPVRAMHQSSAAHTSLDAAVYSASMPTRDSTGTEWDTESVNATCSYQDGSSLVDSEGTSVSISEEGGVGMGAGRYAEPQAEEMMPISDQLQQIWRTVQLQSVWRPMAFVYLYNLFQVRHFESRMRLLLLHLLSFVFTGR